MTRQQGIRVAEAFTPHLLHEMGGYRFQNHPYLRSNIERKQKDKIMQNLNFTIGKELQHQGICDASGAVALDDNSFIVANDEDNILRVYSANASGEPIE